VTAVIPAALLTPEVVEWVPQKHLKATLRRVDLVIKDDSRTPNEQWLLVLRILGESAEALGYHLEFGSR
jgi:hypothetical protein